MQIKLAKRVPILREKNYAFGRLKQYWHLPISFPYFLLVLQRLGRANLAFEFPLFCLCKKSELYSWIFGFRGLFFSYFWVCSERTLHAKNDHCPFHSMQVFVFTVILIHSGKNKNFSESYQPIKKWHLSMKKHSDKCSRFLDVILFISTSYYSTKRKVWWYFAKKFHLVWAILLGEKSKKVWIWSKVSNWFASYKKWLCSRC